MKHKLDMKKTKKQDIKGLKNEAIAEVLHNYFYNYMRQIEYDKPESRRDEFAVCLEGFLKDRIKAKKEMGTALIHESSLVNARLLFATESNNVIPFVALISEMLLDILKKEKK